MKKAFYLLLVAIVLTSCTNTDPNQQLQNLTGYWTIEKVEVENDSVVEYSLSQYIDYIEIKDSVGFRKKLQPKIDGGYIKASNDSEKITAKIEDDVLNLYYSTAFDEWQETVLIATEDELVIKNRDDKKYYYKKYEPLISTNEEETKE
ncbi:lipocalin family protein [Christiangramia sp. OXR-203]|uniref:lipocalin family protein n=1 Tax=Christiangramia sp. OXR-203 TaxID=3100176 RepID=UPI002AC97E04|nr:lipocalin family protein [Christiangramia sp. OXR-203]WPY97743.1 lipocalin family protein [Christiangramia sp. OXR-203]